MGRTLPTFNMILEQEIKAWRPFRRALGREDRLVLDRLFVFAKRHMSEAAYVARPVPFDTLVLAIVLEQQKQIEALHAQLGKESSAERAPDSSPGGFCG